MKKDLRLHTFLDLYVAILTNSSASSILTPRNQVTQDKKK